MKYPKTGSEVYVSLNLSNTMLTGIGKGTITREEVSASYLKRLFAEHGVIVSAKPEQRRLLEIVNERCDLELEIPEQLKLFQLSEEHRRLVVIEVTGLRRKNGSLLPEYTEEEFNEATFAFVKYYVQGTHYDTLVEENKKLKFAGAGAGVAEPHGQLMRYKKRRRRPSLFLLRRAQAGAFRAPARVTFFCCQKKVTKENHSNLRFKDPLARGGFRRPGGESIFP